MTATLTPEQAYAAMFHFIETYCQGDYDKEIGGLLSSMAMLPDGRPADPAFVVEWQESIDFALAGGKAPDLDLRLNPKPDSEAQPADEKKRARIGFKIGDVED